MSFESLKSRHTTQLGKLEQGSLNHQGTLELNKSSHLFKFKLSNRSSQAIQLQGLKQDATLSLLSRRGTLLKKSKQAGTSDESISTTNLQSGTYYLKVRLNGNGATDYTLTSASIQSAERSQAVANYVAGDGISSEELKLYNTINNYRKSHGLPAIRFSKALSTVANRHVIDLQENVGYVTHSWSDSPYDVSDPKTYKTIWEAPQRLDTGYTANGYENIYGNGGRYTASAKDAFSGWKASKTHNAVMLNKDVWKHFTWKALGVGIYKGFASIWFGDEVDPTGKPEIEG